MRWGRLYCELSRSPDVTTMILMKERESESEKGKWNQKFDDNVIHEVWSPEIKLLFEVEKGKGKLLPFEHWEEIELF